MHKTVIACCPGRGTVKYVSGSPHRARSGGAVEPLTDGGLSVVIAAENSAVHMVYIRAVSVCCAEARTLRALRKSNGFKRRCRSLICIAFNAFALEGSVIGHSKYELTAHGERLCKLKLKRFAVVCGVP